MNGIHRKTDVKLNISTEPKCKQFSQVSTDKQAHSKGQWDWKASYAPSGMHF